MKSSLELQHIVAQLGIDVGRYQAWKERQHQDSNSMDVEKEHWGEIETPALFEKAV